MSGDGLPEGASVAAKAGVLAAAVVPLLGVLLVARPAHAVTFEVSSTGDGAAATRDGICASNFTLTDTCTLRAAIQESNRSTATDDTITLARARPSWARRP